MTDQSSEPAAGDLTSGTAMTYKTFSVSLSDPAFFVASSLPANRFRLKGKAALTVNATDAVFETSRKRFLMFADDDQLTLPLSSVVNVQRTGKKLRLEIAPDQIDAALITKGAGPPFITVWAADEPEAAELEALLPQRQSEQFSRERADAIDFQMRLRAVTSKAYVTPTLVVLNVVVFLLMLLTGAGFMTPNGAIHVAWGSNFGPFTTSGQWWRLFTSTFIHFGFIHLLLNMWALYETGRVVERLYGNFYYLVIYVLAGLAGSLASVLWNPMVNSAGASGAIFGVFGAMVSFMLDKRNQVPLSVMKEQRNGTYAFIAYSLFYGFSHAGIDNAAHLGGLAAGFLLGLALARPLDPARRTKSWARLGGSMAALAVAAVLLARPIGLEPHSAIGFLLRGEERMKQRDSDNAIADFNEAVRLDPKYAYAYLNRGKAWLIKGDYERAIADLNDAIKLDPKSGDSYVYRAVAGLFIGEYDRVIADSGEAISRNAKVGMAYNIRAGAWQAKGEFMRAIADFNEAIRVEPKNGSFYYQRGLANFYHAQYSSSATDFADGLLLKDADAYMVIWRFLALARSGNAQTARSELASSGAAGDRAKWPAPIIDFLRGKTDANGLLAAAENADPKTRRGQVCEAEFYLAESYLIDNREREARELLERAEQGCPRDFTEYRGAVVELKRLGG